MFKKMKNIDTAFRYVRLVSLIAIGGFTVLSGYIIYKGYALTNATQQRIYVLVNGKALEAFAADRKDNIPVEAKDHVQMFHQYFFALSPDDKAIQSTISKALYLADGSAKRQYDNLKEGNYYSSLISGNVNQTLLTDSVTINTNQYPFYFRYYGKQQLTRPSSLVTRSLISEGYLRNVARSENNAHGFLIERWTILENRDVEVKNR